MIPSGQLLSEGPTDTFRLNFSDIGDLILSDNSDLVFNLNSLFSNVVYFLLLKVIYFSTGSHFTERLVDIRMTTVATE